jgi:hypothetical protein
VYFSGTDPSTCYINGERARGLVNEPIEVIPADHSLLMKRESRIRFSKTIPVEMNVKVKDIGRVSYDHMSMLVAYWQAEFYRAAAGQDRSAVTGQRYSVTEGSSGQESNVYGQINTCGDGSEDAAKPGSKEETLAADGYTGSPPKLNRKAYHQSNNFAQDTSSASQGQISEASEGLRDSGDTKREQALPRADPAPLPETSEGYFPNEGRSLHDLCNELLRCFEDALGENNGWAWQNLDLAMELHETTIRLEHWKSSIFSLTAESLTTGAAVSQEDDVAARKWLDSLESVHPYLSGLIFSYLDDMRDTVSNMQAFCSSPDNPKE